MDKQFGPWRLIKKLGEGSYTEVFEAIQGGQICALKKLKPHLIYDSERIAPLKQEAKVLQRLQGKPHFPQSISFNQEGDEYYLVMELIHGWSFSELIEKRAKGQIKFPWEDCVQMVCELCDGIELLHSERDEQGRPLIHGDLKPSNVMLDKHGSVRIIDLGLVGGTFSYLPLERLHEKIKSEFTDVFAIGHILYELLHGRKFFTSQREVEIYFEMRDKAVGPNSFDSALPMAVKEILGRCLNQTHPMRYSRIEPLREDLKECVASHPWDVWFQILKTEKDGE